MTAAIEAIELTRRFGAVTAVDRLQLEVPEGEIFGFLGPNGAGKTTAVRMLVGLLKPTSGTVRIHGRDVQREGQAVRAMIGVALQEAALDPLMTGAELLALQAALHGMKRAATRRRIAETVDQLMLGDFTGRRVGTLSGGMRRRLDLALAVLPDPRVLFLDEPTTGLDLHSRRAMWDEVKRLRTESGTTVFLTTQYLEEADQLADRLALIGRGRLLVVDTPERLKHAYGTTVVKLTVAGADQDRAVAALRHFGVVDADADAETIEVRVRAVEAPLEQIVSLLHEERIPVTALTVREASLDDAFVSVTGAGVTLTPDLTEAST